MKAYIICAIFVTLINYINEKYFIKKNKILECIFLMIISIFLLCIIAGVRDITVGTDITVYVTRLMTVVESSPNIIDYLISSESDIFFSLIIFLGFKLGDINTVLFIIELMVVIPIYIYAYLEKNEKSFTLVNLVFFLTMYCVSLNFMRQSIAMAFCILSYHFFDCKKEKKAFLLIMVAMLFHKTAVIFVGIFFINYLIKNNIKYRSINIILIIFGSLLVCQFMENIVALSSYSDYLDRANQTFSLGSIIKKLFWFAICLPCLMVNRRNQEYHTNIILCAIYTFIAVIFTAMSFSIPGTGRLAYYFTNLSYFILLFEIPKSFRKKNIILLILIIIIIFSWWSMTAVDNDTSGVYPYHSDIWHFLN